MMVDLLAAALDILWAALKESKKVEKMVASMVEQLVDP